MDAFREVVTANWLHRYIYTEYDHITDSHEVTRIAFTCVPVAPMTMAGNATVVWANGANMIPEMIHAYTDGSSSEDAVAWWLHRYMLGSRRSLTCHPWEERV